jgi:DNA-binding cell septation regulator SpoVG
MTAKILKLNLITGRGNLQAVADVELDLGTGEPVVMHGCRVIQQPGQSPYVALPQVETARGRFFAAVSAPGLRTTIEPTVLDAWRKSLATQ